MSPLTLAALFFAAGVVLFVAEVMLPSHGVLGLAGAAALLAGVVTCFRVSQYAGLAAAVAVVAAAPFGAMLWVKVWPHTYAGKRMILPPPPKAAAPAPPVAVGEVGVVVSELRPSGTCAFGASGGTRVEARAERGTIPAGARVEVVAVVDNRPVVRAV